MGLSSKKQKSTTSTASNSTATTTPIAPTFIQAPTADYYGKVSGLLSQPPRSTYGPSGLQQRAFSQAASLGAGNPAYSDALNGSRSLLTYTPDNVEAGQLSGTNLAPYMDPWTNEVINAGLGDIERFRELGINNDQSTATTQGAFSNSRLGLERAATNEAALRSAGALASGLRSEGFRRAQDLALADIGNRFGAQQANQQAGLAGANLRLGAANQLGSQALSGEANSRANIGLLSGLGGEERAIAQENDPQNQQLQLLAQIQGLLGINPSMFIGQTATGRESGTSTTTAKQSGSGLDALAQILRIAAAARGGS